MQKDCTNVSWNLSVKASKLKVPIFQEVIGKLCNQNHLNSKNIATPFKVVSTSLRTRYFNTIIFIILDDFIYHISHISIGIEILAKLKSFLKILYFIFICLNIVVFVILLNWIKDTHILLINLILGIIFLTNFLVIFSEKIMPLFIYKSFKVYVTSVLSVYKRRQTFNSSWSCKRTWNFYTFCKWYETGP